MCRRIQSLQFGPAVAALLAANDLPTSDLSGSPNVLLFGCTAACSLAGVVGLELYGEHGLLRSLAVTAAERGSGLGTFLTAHAERQAARHGVQSLYLLTITAPRFFDRLGYVHARRQEAPVVIASTSQFSGLCPSSSAFMMKRLAE